MGVETPAPILKFINYKIIMEDRFREQELRRVSSRKVEPVYKELPKHLSIGQLIEVKAPTKKNKSKKGKVKKAKYFDAKITKINRETNLMEVTNTDGRKNQKNIVVYDSGSGYEQLSY